MSLIETLGSVGQKQRLRLELEDGETVEGRVSQSVYAPDENLRLEVSPEGSDRYLRFQVRARVEDGAWTQVGVRGYDGDRGVWIDLGAIADVAPDETYRTLESEDMEAQEETGTEG